MKKVNGLFVLVLVAVAILSGCMSSGRRSIKTVSGFVENESKRALRVRPALLLGIIETPAIKAGKATVTVSSPSQRLFGEYFPLRMGWDNIAIRKSDKKEITSQALFSGVMKVKKGIEHIYHSLFVNVTDGTPEETKDVYIVHITSDQQFIVGPAGFVEIDREKFFSDEDYKAEMVINNGFRLGDCRYYQDYLDIIQAWSIIETPIGRLRAPITEAMFNSVAGENPKDTYFKKWISITDGRVGDPNSMIEDTAWSLWTARKVKDNLPILGDYAPREYMGLAFELLETLTNNAIENFNDPIKTKTLAGKGEVR